MMVWSTIVVLMYIGIFGYFVFCFLFSESDNSEEEKTVVDEVNGGEKKK